MEVILWYPIVGHTQQLGKRCLEAVVFLKIEETVADNDDESKVDPRFVEGKQMLTIYEEESKVGPNSVEDSVEEEQVLTTCEGVANEPQEEETPRETQP